MKTLAEIAPDFVAEVKIVLEAEGQAALAEQIEGARITRCTYDRTVDAGYIYFDRLAPNPLFTKLAAPVAETLPFASPHWFNIDVDHDGQLFGIELLGRRDVRIKLRAAKLL